MKTRVISLILATGLQAVAATANAQQAVILIRHAELQGAAMAEPKYLPLSEAGEVRAQRLASLPRAALSHVRPWALLIALLAPAVQAQQAQAQTKSEKVFRATVNAEGVQVVEIVGGGYFFDPKRIIVRVNVPVELKVRKEAGIVPHDITIDAPDGGVQVKESLGTDPKSIKLAFTKTGEYAFYCGKKPPFVKSHRERGMEGTFQVVE